jgi:hypothetical protein
VDRPDSKVSRGGKDDKLETEARLSSASQQEAFNRESWLNVQKRFGQRTLRRNNEYKKTCYHPNRLNLLSLTVGSGARSSFLRKIRV